MFVCKSFTITQNEDQLNLAPSPWASASVGRRLDSELASQLRILLRPEFEAAQSWSELCQALKAKGFSLRVKQGRLRLVDSLSRVDICSTGYLGFPIGQLEHVFGVKLQEANWEICAVG